MIGEEEKLIALQKKVSGKRVLFVTTKNLDYLRNVQEIRFLEEAGAKVTVWGKKDSSYGKRLLWLYPRLLFRSLKKYDVVFLGFSPQLIIPLFGWKLRKKAVISDFFISVYDTMVNDRGRFKKKSLLARFSRHVDKRTLQRSELVLTDTRADANYFAEEFGAPREKLITYYITGDREIYFPRPQKKPDKWKDRFLVLYFGSILPLQGVEVLFGTMEQFREEKNIQFLFIGPVEKKLTPPRQENIKYISWLPQEKLAAYIAAADLCLAGHFRPEIEKARRTIPGKAMIYETMERPMILGDNPANREFFPEDEKHTFVPMGNEELLAEVIRQKMEAFRK